MTEAFGPYCGYPADTDMPRSAWGSCGKPFDGHRGPHRRPRQRRTRACGHSRDDPDSRPAHDARHLPRSREEVFTADGFYPTGDLGHLDDDGFMFYHGRSDDMFKVSGATVYPSEVEQALRSIDGVDNAFVTDVSGAVGAVVVGDTRSTAPTAARKLLSSFKIPTVWLLVDSDDAIPRGGTGKVDVRELRKMLTTRLEAR